MPAQNNTPTLADIVAQVISNLPNLAHSRSYTLRDLVGHRFWATIPKPLKIKLGQEFRGKVDQGVLPLVYVGTTSCNKALYQPHSKNTVGGQP